MTERGGALERARVAHPDKTLFRFVEADGREHVLALPNVAPAGATPDLCLLAALVAAFDVDEVVHT